MLSSGNFKRFIPDIILVVVVLVMTTLYVSSVGSGFPLDDAWIHQTYGRNLAETGLWSFVPGVVSAASTSPMYTIVLSIGYKLGIPFALWTHGLGALSLALTALIVRRMALQVAPRLPGIGLATGLAIIFSWHLLWAAASGMETALFSLMTITCIAWAWRELSVMRSSRVLHVILRGVVFGALAAITTLTRPEGILLIAIIGLCLLIARPNMRWFDVMIWGVASIFSFGVLMTPYLLFNLDVTGGLLPTTASAKQIYAAPIRALGFFWGLRLMTIPLLAGGQILLIPGLIVYVIMVLKRLRNERTALLYLLPPVWGIALIALYAWWLPLNFQHGRYVIPALPSLIFAGVVGTGWLLKMAQRPMIARVLVRALALGAALLMVVFVFGPGLSSYQLDVRVINEEMVAPAHWIAENLPPDEMLAIHDIGAVGYFAPRRMMDIAGLVSPEFIDVIADPEGQWALMEQGSARYLMAFPDQLPAENIEDVRLCPIYESEGNATTIAGGKKMTVYILVWDGVCPDGININTTSES